MLPGDILKRQEIVSHNELGFWRTTCIAIRKEPHSDHVAFRRMASRHIHKLNREAQREIPGARDILLKCSRFHRIYWSPHCRRDSELFIKWQNYAYFMYSAVLQKNGLNMLVGCKGKSYGAFMLYKGPDDQIHEVNIND